MLIILPLPREMAASIRPFTQGLGAVAVRGEYDRQRVVYSAKRPMILGTRGPGIGSRGQRLAEPRPLGGGRWLLPLIHSRDLSMHGIYRDIISVY
jgi:hypothetical protein